MTKPPVVLTRHQLNADAWDACVAASPQRILYGYSWYLDAVLPAPSWKWVGLVDLDETGQYKAVMPIPLRRKQIMGISYEWVVHQPFFCQFLAIFSREATLDPAPFWQIIHQRFRYGSILNVQQRPDRSGLFNALRQQATHTLDLSTDYKTIYQNYTRDRQVNLRRAVDFNWTVIDATDTEPLLRLFRENHARTIAGGVADWAYSLFRNVTNELNQRGLVTLRYAVRDGRIEAGALFARDENRIIYLFNAASPTGRRGNARTLLLDQIIRENAGRRCPEEPFVFDFESPEKPSIQKFYQSFGAVESLFWTVGWSRLNRFEQGLQRMLNK